MDAARVVGTPASRHAPSKGSISAGSASSARITSSARPSRSAFFTCLMPTTFLDSRCSSTVGHPHVFARQDSRGHTHARMNYSRINEIRQLYLCPEKRKFSIFSAIARLSPASAQSPKRHRAPLSISRGFPQKKPRRVLRPQAQNKIDIMLSGGSADWKHTSQPASVEFFDPKGQKLCAQSGCIPSQRKIERLGRSIFR